MSEVSSQKQPLIDGHKSGILSADRRANGGPGLATSQP